jgi:hypothetical protein
VRPKQDATQKPTDLWQDLVKIVIIIVNNRPEPVKKSLNGMYNT